MMRTANELLRIIMRTTIMILMISEIQGLERNKSIFCGYSCESDGGCKVTYNGPYRSGSLVGFCFSQKLGGSCFGIPQECRSCLDICKPSGVNQTNSINNPYPLKPHLNPYPKKTAIHPHFNPYPTKIAINTYVKKFPIDPYPSKTSIEDDALKPSIEDDASKPIEDDSSKPSNEDDPSKPPIDDSSKPSIENDTETTLSRQSNRKPFLSRQSNRKPFLSRQSNRKPFLSRQSNRKPFLSRQSNRKPSLSRQSNRKPSIQQEPPKALESNPCEYSCLSDGGCRSKYIGAKTNGSVTGYCFSRHLGGQCHGIPQECQVCHNICNPPAQYRNPFKNPYPLKSHINPYPKKPNFLPYINPYPRKFPINQYPLKSRTNPYPKNQNFLPYPNKNSGR